MKIQCTKVQKPLGLFPGNQLKSTGNELVFWGLSSTCDWMGNLTELSDYQLHNLATKFDATPASVIQTDNGANGMKPFLNCIFF